MQEATNVFQPNVILEVAQSKSIGCPERSGEEEDGEGSVLGARVQSQVRTEQVQRLFALCVWNLSNKRWKMTRSRSQFLMEGCAGVSEPSDLGIPGITVLQTPLDSAWEVFGSCCSGALLC